MQLTNFLLPVVEVFGVKRKRLRRWARSCEGAAMRVLENTQIKGIFDPEMQADMLNAYTDYIGA